MTIFCDNNSCALHDVDTDLTSIIIPTTHSYETKEVKQHKYYTNNKTLHFCDVCINVVETIKESS